MQNIFILHATLEKSKHTFMELFTSMENLNTFLNNHPEVTKLEITLHDLNPI